MMSSAGATAILNAAPTVDEQPSLKSANQERIPVDERKISGAAMFRRLMDRLLSPSHLRQAWTLHKDRKANRNAHIDELLRCYSQILTSDFLHFGYFDPLPAGPESMSVSDMTRAQTKYAELVLGLASDKSRPVLDVGCGMGGLSRMLIDRGFTPTALTPDRLQAAHVKNTLPSTEVIRSKLEKMPADEYIGKFGTIITAESLQYLRLDQALPIFEKILAPGGSWIACDYFYKRPANDRSCHVWSEYNQKLSEYGWKITHEQEITQNIVPTLWFAHMIANRLCLPAMSMAILRLKRKQPGIHHLLGGVIDLLQTIAGNNVKIIDPDLFVAEKRYILLKMERV